MNVTAHGIFVRLFAFAGWLAVLPLAAAAEPAVPRYQLEVGQELSYSAKSSLEYQGGSFESEQQWTVWVAARNDDGSWRIIARQAMTFNGGDPRPTLAYFDLFPDGRIVSNRTLGFRMDPATLFVQLPADGGQLESGWESVDSRQDVRRAHQSVVPTDEQTGKFIVEVVKTSPMDEIYLSTARATATFDPQRGLIEHIDNENTQGYGIKGKGTGTVELESVTIRDAEWTEKLVAESSAYFEANERMEELLESALRDAERTSELLDQAKSVLEAARDTATLDDVKGLLESNLANFESLSRYYTESAQRRAEVVGKPAFEFDTTDLEGNAHTLKQYRGSVVILDFWYRGCGWCIRAMPQIKQVAQSFADQPVVVFGMNTDSKEEDARFVIEKMRLDYPNLKAEGLPEKYQVRGFPTLIIIDKDGTVHDIHVGYSPDLAEKVSKSVEGLLAKP